MQLARVAPRLPALHAAYLEKLGARLGDAGVDASDDRLKQELALFATKIDVAEEVARLATHVTETRRVLAQGGSVGKRLDFLAQELHREANTLGSKSVDVELSQVSLELKVLIEQMREQVQNLDRDTSRRNRPSHPESGRILGCPLHRRGAVGRRQKQHGERAARARARHPAFRVVYDACAAARRIGGSPLPLHRRAERFSR